MKTIYLVSEEAAALARRMEKRLVMLPQQSGIVFASVRVKPPTDHDDEIFDVFVGGCLEMEEEAVVRLAQMTLAKDIQEGMQVRYEVRRGLGR